MDLARPPHNGLPDALTDFANVHGGLAWAEKRMAESGDAEWLRAATARVQRIDGGEARSRVGCAMYAILAPGAATAP